MRSSTSSSKEVVVFLAVFLMASLGLHLAHRFTPLSKFKQIPVLADPLPEGYRVISVGPSLVHQVAHFDLYGQSEAMRQAQVLIAGNSRQMNVWRGDHLTTLEEQLGMDVYALGFNHNESNTFFETQVEQYDLNPRYIIVNVDRFFTDDPSPAAEGVEGMTAWSAQKDVWETTLAFHLKGYVHGIWPHLAGRSFPGETLVANYISLENGYWYVGAAKGTPSGVNEKEQRWRRVDDEALVIAERFQREMAERGAELVLMYVPKQQDARAQAQAVAEHLGLPLYSPEVPGLRTWDESHLDRISVDRFMQPLLVELVAHIQGLEQAQP